MQTVLPICFYLPQFHPTRFNDQNWGAGFTEWVNVAKGKPRFAGHTQPKIPGELGFYDLRLPTVLQEQITLAQSYGIYGFCFYHYRFGDTRQLDIPVQQLLARPTPVVPFCLCWANESWTRAWDGKSSEVLLEQDYSTVTIDNLIEDFAQAINDQRYIKIDGKALVLIYQIDKLPQPQDAWISKFREELEIRAGCEILLTAVYSHGMTKDLARLVDMVVQFPPHRLPRRSKRILLEQQVIQPFDPGLSDNYESYESVISASMGGVDLLKNLVPGVCPDWDNSARRGSSAHILVGSSPDAFARWVTLAATASLKKQAAGDIPHPLLFVNAWNEWAEGAVLEPSWNDGRRYLDAFKHGLRAAAAQVDSAEVAQRATV